MTDDDFIYMKDIIANATSVKAIREINRLAYEKVGELNEEHRKTLQVGDPCVVEGTADENLYARIVKINPKLVEIMITDSDSNPADFRGLRAKVNPFQITVMEQI